ncbi:MAG: Ig-like domain-containing protein [Candidatus Limisoma sp.]
MRTSIWKLTAVMILGILSFSSCSDDSESVLPEELLISLDKNELNLEIGQSERLVAGFSPSDATNKAHTWTSENPKIATVDETGNVKGISIGTTKITATALANKATATCIVEVVDKIIAVTSITLNSKEETLCVGATTQLTATINPTNATEKNVVWTSSDNAVATVDDNGLVKGMTVGSANITATVDGKSAVCAITVMEKSVDFSGITFSVQADGSLLVSGTVKPTGVNVSEIGVCFSTETSPTIENNKYVLTTTGLTVNKEINDLTPNSYYTRMYAKEGSTIYYGKSVVVKIPEELTTQFKLIKSTCVYKATSFDSLYDYNHILTISTPKNEDYKYIKLCYGVAPNPEITDQITSFHTNSKGDLEATLNNLTGGRQYFVRAYDLKNGKPIYYPGEKSFITIGSTTKLDIKYSYTNSNSGYEYYTISYTLPSDWDYEVNVHRISGNTPYICKINNDQNTQQLYVSGGSGKIYLKLGIFS